MEQISNAAERIYLKDFFLSVKSLNELYICPIFIAFSALSKAKISFSFSSLFTFYLFSLTILSWQCINKLIAKSDCMLNKLRGSWFFS